MPRSVFHFQFNLIKDKSESSSYAQNDLRQKKFSFSKKFYLDPTDTAGEIAHVYPREFERSKYSW